MILNTIHELYFENNDIYQIESCGDKIIANDDYHGVRILDLSLNTIKTIPFLEKLVIFSIYKKYDNSAVMLYAPEQNNLFFVDLQTFKHFTIKPEISLNDFPFGRNYYWKNDNLIFVDDNRNIFYQVDFKSSAVKKITTKTVKSISPTFLNFSNTCKKHHAITIYPEKETLIFQKNRKLVAFYDYKNKNLILKKHSPGFFEEIFYHNGTFIFFDAWNKNIKFRDNNEFWNAEPPYYCLRIISLANGNIAMLFTNRDDHQKCILQIYECN